MLFLVSVQVVVGATVVARSTDELRRVRQAVQADVASVRSQEVPRMQTVMGQFRIYHWMEIAALCLGGLFAMAGQRGSRLRGVGLALVPEALVMLVLDGMAEQRGADYLAWLLSL